MLTVSAVVQLELAHVSLSFFSLFRMLCEPVHDNTFSRGRVLSTRHFIVKCSQRRTARSLVESRSNPSRDSSGEVFSARDLVSSLKFGFSFRVVVYW